MKKRILLALVCALAVLVCAGCGQQPSAPAEPGEQEIPAAEPVSTNPEDYGITNAMLTLEEEVSIDDLSLEALGAFYLHTDGAGAESSADALYHRFLNDPDAVIRYLSELGGPSERENSDETALSALCRAIAAADVFWYDTSEEFTSILEQCRERYPSGLPADALDRLQAEYDAAIERAAQ